MKDFSKVMLSFIVGALAGAATGILLAPDKGRNTRKKIKNSIDDLSAKAKDSINDLSAKAKRTFNKEKVVKDAEPA
jgi:gas vesicle protein